MVSKKCLANCDMLSIIKQNFAEPIQNPTKPNFNQKHSILWSEGTYMKIEV